MPMNENEDTSGAVAAYLNPVAQPAVAAKAAMTVAADANPQFEAELRRASARTGVPLESARSYPDDVKRQAALADHDFDQLARDFPSTTAFLANPDNARIAHDDVKNLSSTESTIGPITGPKPTFMTYAAGLMKSLPQGAGMAKEGIRMQLADLFGFDSVRDDAQRNYSRLSLEQKIATPDFESSTAQGVYGGLSSTIRAIPGLAASLATRSTAPMLATAGIQTEAEAYAKYRGRGATGGEAITGALGEGAVEVATELLPMGFLVQNMGKMGAGRFLTGLLAREIPGEQAATLVQDAIDTAIANPEKTWGEYAAERPDAAYQTLLATMTQAGVMEGANVALQRVQGRSGEAQRAGEVGEALSRFNALAEASKVRERDSATAQAFFQSLMQDGRDSVWITPQALTESGLLEQMAESIPAVAEQINQAAATGADIRIPVADLVAGMAGPEIEAAIIPHLSEEPGGFTKTTAEEYLASGAAAELGEEVARTLADKQNDDAFTASREAVTAGIQSQLDTAGRFAPTVNQAYASMVGNFYAVQAARLGITPEEMAARYPLQVKAESMPGKRTLEQDDPHGQERYDNIVGAVNYIKANGLGKTHLPKNEGKGEFSVQSREAAALEEKARQEAPKPAPDPHAKERFDSTAKAAIYIRDNKLRDTHAVKQIGRTSYAIKPKPAKVDAATAKERRAAGELRLFDAIRQASESTASRGSTLEQRAIPTLEDFADLGSGFTVADGKLLRNGAPVGDIKLEIIDEPKRPMHLVVRDIRIDSKGKGTGTMALAAIMGKAAQYSLPVALTTESMLGKAHQKRLRAFYERLGFKKNRADGKVKGITEEFVWSPKNTLTQGVDDYGMEHRPPGPEDGAPLHDLTGGGNIYPDDVYSANGARYYGTGNDAMDKQALRIAAMAKDNPDFDVMVFRAVPANVEATDINPGDWITINRAYAEMHGAGFDDGHKILSKMVKASEIYTNGDSIQEWGYWPENTYGQATGGPRGTLTFGDDITQDPSVITLLKNADLSTFLHESGHFFLEVMNDMASRPDAPADIAEDMAKVLEWFGIAAEMGPDYGARHAEIGVRLDELDKAGTRDGAEWDALIAEARTIRETATPEQVVTRTALDIWNSYSIEQKRPHHEAFARGFEAYLFEGRAPTAELVSLFSRFRSWLVNVYKSLTALQVELTGEVRGVFDRMLASSEAIDQAEREAALAGMFGTRPEFMSDEEWTAYRLLSVKAGEDATRELETRSLKDMKWLGNAKSRVLRELQKEANYKRQQVLNEVRKEVMAQPEYQAWQFLTLRGENSTRAWPTPEFKLDPKHVDTRVDNLYVAIAKMGGLNRDEVKTKWGVDHRDMPASGVFGKPILRKSGGLSIERMAEKLVEDHYLDAHDLAEFEDKFDRQRGGQEQFSWEHQWSNGERAPAEPLGDSNYHGKLHTPMLRHMYGEDSPVVQQLIKGRMTATDGGLDPDIVAEMLGGFASGREMVDAIVAVPSPSTLINQLVDQRMLERFGDLTSEEAIDRAVNEALHQKAHIRFVQTELAALQKAAGKPAVLAKAAQTYAEQIIKRTPIAQLRPDKFTSAARRAGRAADKAFKAGDIQAAAAEKQAQLINAYAAKAALDARNDVEKTMVRFKTITNGNNEKVAKTRDLDMVMATRAILAEYGIGTRGKRASEYLASVDAYDPAMAAVLRERIDAATENARPLNELTIEQLGALRDEVESLWFLAKRSRQMEVDGDLMDRQDIQEALVARLEEIGVPAEGVGEKRAITPGEVAVGKLQSLRAALRRVESWADAKDGDNAMGPFRRFIWNTVKDRADAYRADKAKYLKAYRALLDTVAPTLDQVKIAAPELDYTFGFDKGGMGKVELLHAILHTGNAGNKKKLLLGRRWATENADGSLNTSRWDGFIERMIAEGTLSRADFDFAQGVWDLLEEMKPAAQKAHREVFGRYFDEVTADPFTVTMKGGQVVNYAGGYVPAIADARIVIDAKTRAIMEDEAATLMNALPSTSKGFTKSRVEYNRPLLLDLRLLAQHIDKVLLFSHLEQPVRDVRRILGHSSVAKPLARLDPAAYDGLLIPWLNRTARQQVETQVDGSNGLMRFFSVVRQRAGMAAMFANVSNTVQQLTGFSLAALKVKPAYLMRAGADFVRSPKTMADSVAAASPYMANRMDNEVAAMTGAINDILLNPGVYEKAVGWTVKHTYFMQSAMDNVMGPIIWTGAYNQALETAPAGMSDDDLVLYARRLADSAVRETQGSTLPEDISRIETGNAFVRLFTQFAGYFNMQANLLGTEFAKTTQEAGLRKGMGRGFYILLFGFLMPAWAAQAIALAFRGGPEDEDKDGEYIDDWLAATIGWGTLRSATALVPVVGQTMNSLANAFNKKPYDDRISTGPAISMIESAARVPADVYKLATGEGDGPKVRDVATLVTMTLGVPATAVARPVGYLVDVGSGKTDPLGPVDVGRGLVTGASSPASKGR